MGQTQFGKLGARSRGCVPTRVLRDEINATIREGLVAQGVIDGPARQGEKLVLHDLPAPRWREPRTTGWALR